MPFVTSPSAQVSSSPTTPTTATKRTASSSPRSSPISNKVQKVDSVELGASFDEEFDFDQDALIEATLEAEEQESKKAKSSSQPSSSLASSTSSTSTSTSAKTASTTNAAAINKVVKSSPSTPVKGTMLSHGDARVEEETMDSEWYARLKDEMKKGYFVKLKSFLQEESRQGKVIYPPAHLVHSWSRLTPLSTVKVVIVGQDPYHGPNQACGHSFSVPKGVPVPGSLRNIYKELGDEYGPAFKAPKHGCLDGWATQGVLLLNACLTVSAGAAGSHHNKGWEPFTQTVLRAIADDASHGAKASIKSSTIANMFSKVDAKVKEEGKEAKAKPSQSTSSSSSSSKGVVFLAWGQPAQKSLAEAGITDKLANVLILKSTHPSPLSAHRGFLGNGHFKRANDWLEAEHRYGKGAGIQWQNL